MNKIIEKIIATCLLLMLIAIAILTLYLVIASNIDFTRHIIETKSIKGFYSIGWIKYKIPFILTIAFYLFFYILTKIKK